EQAAGRLDELGPAADIFSLGATLYEMLTGQCPYVNSDLSVIQRGDFPPPRRVAAGVPPPLEAGCLKAMAVRPGDRYATADAPAVRTGARRLQPDGVRHPEQAGDAAGDAAAPQRTAGQRSDWAGETAEGSRGAREPRQHVGLVLLSHGRRRAGLGQHRGRPNP